MSSDLFIQAVPPIFKNGIEKSLYFNSQLSKIVSAYSSENYTEAKSKTEKCLSMCKLKDNPHLHLNCLCNLAASYYALGHLQESKSIYDQAYATLLALLTENEEYFQDPLFLKDLVRVLGGQIILNLADGDVDLVKNKFEQVLSICGLESMKGTEFEQELFKYCLEVFLHLDSIKNFLAESPSVNSPMLESPNLDNEGSIDALILHKSGILHELIGHSEYAFYIHKQVHKLWPKTTNNISFGETISLPFMSIAIQNQNNPDQAKELLEVWINIISQKLNLQGKLRKVDKILADQPKKINAAKEMVTKLQKMELTLEHTGIIPQTEQSDLGDYNRAILLKIGLCSFLAKGIRAAHNLIANYDIQGVQKTSEPNLDHLSQALEQMEMCQKMVKGNELGKSILFLPFSDEAEQIMSTQIKKFVDNCEKISLRYSWDKFDNYLKSSFYIQRSVQKRQAQFEKSKFFHSLVQPSLTVVQNGAFIYKLHCKKTGKVKKYFRIIEGGQYLLWGKDLAAVHNLNLCRMLKLSCINEVIFGRLTNITNQPAYWNEKPWCMISLITDRRSYDLIMDESQINYWYYGLSYSIKLQSINCRIPDWPTFLWAKIKMKYGNMETWRSSQKPLPKSSLIYCCRQNRNLKSDHINYKIRNVPRSNGMKFIEYILTHKDLLIGNQIS